MADVIIYATARIEGAPLVISDFHFEGLEEVVFIKAIIYSFVICLVGNLGE